MGSQLRWHKLDHDAKPLFWALLFKLILFPAVIFILYFFILKQRGEMIEAAFLESAMGPMVTAAIIAAAHKLEPKLCNLILGVGIPLSFITLTIWYLLMKYSGVLEI